MVNLDGYRNPGMEENEKNFIDLGVWIPVGAGEGDQIGPRVFKVGGQNQTPFWFDFSRGRSSNLLMLPLRDMSPLRQTPAAPLHLHHRRLDRVHHTR